MKKRTLKLLMITGSILLSILIISIIFGEKEPSGNVALIKIRGVIAPDSDLGGSSSTPADQLVKNIKRAEANPSVKAVLIDINSPGGSAVASEEIANAIKESKKPTFALIRDIGTSGAYWAASSTDSITASPISITGSVGATASYLEFSGLFQKYGVGYERVVSGDLKDIGSPFKNLTREEQEILEEMITSVGNYFIQRVKQDRNLTQKSVEKIKTGRFFTGKQAKELGLIDHLGGMRQTEELIKQKTGIKKIQFAVYEIKKPFSISSLLSSAAATAGKNAAQSLTQQKRPLVT